jgi:hypothetical protein
MAHKKNTTHTVALTIGRNIGNAPMAAHEWDTFRTELGGCLAQVFGSADGRGEWDGVEEDTHYVVGLAVDVDALRARLAELGAAYSQDAIGCVAMAGTDSTVMAAGR